MLAGQFYEQKIVDHREAQDRGIEKRNEKQARRAQGSRKGDDLVLPGIQVDGQMLLPLAE